MWLWLLILNFVIKILGGPQDGSDLPEIPNEQPPKPPAPPAPMPVNHRFLWCLDNGHGIKQKGKHSPPIDNYRFKEYEFNRDVVQRIARKLSVLGIPYEEIMPTVNVGSALATRVHNVHKIKTDKQKILVSVHSNALGSGDEWYPNVEGGQVYYYDGSSIGRELSEVFYAHITKLFAPKGIKPNKSFYVLRKTACPAILTENGFYTHPEEVKRLLDPDFREEVAQAHVDAILEFEKHASI
jgi:N-acetylmuramoyl-L-alanine amidase